MAAAQGCPPQARESERSRRARGRDTHLARVQPCIEVLVLVVHVGEAQLGEMLSHAALAVVGIVDTQLLLHPPCTLRYVRWLSSGSKPYCGDYGSGDEYVDYAEGFSGGDW